MPKVSGRNRHQKAAHRVGERRVGADEIPQLLELAASADPEERLVAARYLCPCHVRRRIEAVWAALYRLLEDPDARVRRAAWHTLGDGGRPADPALDALLARTLAEERDPQVRHFAEQLAGPRRQAEQAVARLAARPTPRQRGRCDFCGEPDRPVEPDFQTVIPSGDTDRAARICEECRG